MQVLKSALTKTKRLDLKALSEVLSTGLDNCPTDDEKKNLGLQAMK